MSAELPTAAELQAAANWVNQVIAKRWAPGASGPDAYTCWTLARATQKTLSGIDLPLVDADPDDVRAVVRAINDSPLRAEWADVSSPRHLDLVRMSHSRVSHHIGTYLELDGGGILHCAKQFDAKGKWAPNKPAVAFAPLHALPLEGWAHLAFQRYQGGRL